MAVGGLVMVRRCSAGVCRRILYHGSYYAGKSVVAEERSQVRTNDIGGRRDTSRVLMLHAHWKRPRSEVKSQGAVLGGLLPNNLGLRLTLGVTKASKADWMRGGRMQFMAVVCAPGRRLRTLLVGGVTRQPTNLLSKWYYNTTLTRF